MSKEMDIKRLEKHHAYLTMWKGNRRWEEGAKEMWEAARISNKILNLKIELANRTT